MKVAEYLDRNGLSPFGRWFAEIDTRAASKVTIAVARMGQGNLSNVKSVGSGVLEYRIDYGPGYRVYFGRDGDELVILLIGGTKTRQQKDIEAAKAFWLDYKSRKNIGKGI
ncbi:type II toxin-antitoxin system RelE/ParE family toxin [Agrobacterium pusense]|uniref:type II toxin-antitoxin system RelE/ParE family toxin n=1 Tax=Agrobacterium pusense TaxID=648995 RepID=UPI001C6ECD6C|nr:type II toxin-antitoxin system RelE/ParE family toxin [Agrobacterium pusense]MBW9068191.1 type II toxin-antitoxin system RelE/ParE family toxin [Agrobacterium pusense]MBW9081863.1 type II toxin-antitoxin system RelE/ParE family toxin [Agrobacterium pusense]MBW9122811.1 type II toxin-antitoxin system RelE/ParE family toxin [Agrobacterium pusense]MBW9136973.1 type II toxin-antitoxin system RelE/ParE family toxin [Agrobacterium pusense]